MGKSSTGAAAADALAKILGVYLTTSAKEKDRNIDQQRWQANFELQKQQHQVEMQRAAREQAAYDKAQAEDKDINGILSSLQAQGITPPSGVDTRHELTSWLNIQNDIQDASEKRKKASREDEMFPLEKARITAETNAANRRGTTTKKPKELRDWIPDFMLPEFDMTNAELQRVDKEFQQQKDKVSSMDSTDFEERKKASEVLDAIANQRIMLGQRLGEMGKAVIEDGIDTPEKWDAHNQKLHADFTEQKMLEKQKTPPVIAPKAIDKPENAPGFRDPNAQNSILTLFKGLVNPGPNPFLPTDQNPTVQMPDVQMLTKPSAKESKPAQSNSLLNAETIAAIRAGSIPSYQPPAPVVQPSRMDAIRQFLLGQNANAYGN